MSAFFFVIRSRVKEKPQFFGHRVAARLPVATAAPKVIPLVFYAKLLDCTAVALEMMRSDPPVVVAKTQARHNCQAKSEISPGKAAEACPFAPFDVACLLLSIGPAHPMQFDSTDKIRDILASFAISDASS
jgi:hypothetical protein